MKNLQTEIIMNASKQKVWEVLIDFEKYEEWNPFIQSIIGEKVLGGKLENKLCIEGQKPMTFKPTITKLEEQKHFSWLGKLFLTGLFDGEHYFELQELEPNRVKLIHGENFSGVLVAIILKKIKSGTLAGFHAMNEALKTRAEQF